MNLLKATQILLTTKDNKFNPFTENDEWRKFDTDILSHAYNTDAYVTRSLAMRGINPTKADAEDLVQTFEEIIQRNNELGYDIYEIITPDGTRMDHVPDYLLFEKFQ